MFLRSFGISMSASCLCRETKFFNRPADMCQPCDAKSQVGETAHLAIRPTLWQWNAHTPATKRYISKAV